MVLNILYNKIMFNFLNVFAEYNYIYFKNKVFQTKKFYSAHSVNVPFITPIISYLNADLNKTTIIKQNKSKSGIYRWVNVTNNKDYVGSSINLGRRFKEYYNYNHISQVRRNVPIHSALLKYGYSSFKLEILEYCDINNLLNREQYYIDTLKPKYNVLKKAGSWLGSKHSESTKRLFSIIRLGHRPSEATRLKMIANNHKSIPIMLTNVKTGNTIKFPSISKTGQFLGVSETTVRNCIKQNKGHKGYIIIKG